MYSDCAIYIFKAVQNKNKLNGVYYTANELLFNSLQLFSYLNRYISSLFLYNFSFNELKKMFNQT